MDIVTPILNIVSVLCSCSANNRCSYLLDLQENKEDLNNALVELRATRDGVKIRVDEAENNPNHKCTPEVDNWLQCVQAIVDEVVQVIQNADQEIQGKCFGGNFPKNRRSAHKIGKLVIRKLATVKEHRSKGNFGDVAYRLPPSFVQKEPMDLTVGMKSMFDEVWSSLAEDEARIMGLYGQGGGVGKTTLLKQINNKFLESTTTTTTHSYDVVILVVVSGTLNIDTIQMEIGKKLGLSSPDRTRIFNALTKKNFLLLLDDIWKRVDLQSIGIPHPENKSNVIFTARSENVCGDMDADKFFRVKCLPWDEAWTLFQEKVGNETLNSHPKLPDLAKVVAKECGGLPLALITIGRAMSTKKSLQEWNHAITTLRKSASDFPGMGNEVLPLLKLRYDSLRNDTIKSCFLYCAIYPEDCSINISKLIDYWIGEGFLNEFGHIDEARNQGYDIIGILKGACLLETGKFRETVKMHDSIRDLALWIAHECGSKRDKILIMDTSDITSERLWYNAKRIYMGIIHNGKMEVTVPLSTLKSPNLLTLIYKWTFCTLLIIPQNFFSFMPLLRVLDLSYSRIETFPTSITELLELRYLSLSITAIQALPEELGKLVKLNYLDLSHMSNLQKIPSGVIDSLLELRVFNLFFCYAVWDFDKMYKLKHLNDLGININTQHNLNKLLSKQSLQMCTRHLHLFSSPSPSPSPSSSTTTLGISKVKSLEKLELLSNLEKLFLDSLPELMNVNMGVWENHYNYMAQEAPFQNLSEIIIGHCNALKDLTWVGYVPNLERFCVDHCEELEEIVLIVDDLGGSTGGGGGGDEISMVMNNMEDMFKRLKRLAILHLPKSKSIYRNALAFPCLESMLIVGCPRLKKLPFDSGSNLNNILREITGRPKWWSELQWEDNNTKLKFLPYFSDYNY